MVIEKEKNWVNSACNTILPFSKANKRKVTHLLSSWTEGPFFSKACTLNFTRQINSVCGTRFSLVHQVTRFSGAETYFQGPHLKVQPFVYTRTLQTSACRWDLVPFHQTSPCEQFRGGAAILPHFSLHMAASDLQHSSRLCTQLSKQKQLDVRRYGANGGTLTRFHYESESKYESRKPLWVCSGFCFIC